MLADVLYAPLYADILDVLYGEDGAIPSFQLNLNSSLTPKYALGSMTPSYTRATTATFTDYQGQILDAQSNQARIEGNRVVTNLITASEDMTNGAYVLAGNGETVNSATEIDFNGTANGRITQPVTITDDGSGAGGRTFTFSVEVKLNGGTTVSSGDSGVQVQIAGDAITSIAQNIGNSLTSDWQRFSVTASTDAAGTSVEIQVRSNDDLTLGVRKFQLEEVTNNITHAPSEYVSTGVQTGATEYSPQAALDTDETGSWSSFADTFEFDTDHYRIARVDTDGRAFRAMPTAPTVGKDYVLEVEAAAASGTEVINVGPTNSAGTDQTYLTAYTATTTRSTFRVTFTATADTTHVALWNDAANSDVSYYSISVKEADHGLNRDGVKAFNYHNGNTVASTGVVTEAQGPAINSSTSQWIELDGTSGCYVSTGDNSSNSVTGDGTWIAWAAADDWTPSARKSFVGKWETTGNLLSYLFDINTDGTLRLALSPDGTVGAIVTGSSTASTGFADGTGHWVRVTFDDSADTVNFYTSDQPIGTAISALSWTQLGEADVAISISGIDDNASVVEIGSAQTGTDELFAGKISRALVIASTDPTADPVVDFNANDYEAGVTWETQSQKESNSNLVTNGGPTFTETTGWTGYYGGSASVVSGELRVTEDGADGTQARITTPVSTTIGKTYVVSLTTGTGGTSASSAASNNADGSSGIAFVTGVAASTSATYSFAATASTTYITFGVESTTAAAFSNLASMTIVEQPDLWTLNGTAKAFSPLAKWGDFPGSSGDYFSTPDQALPSSGDIDAMFWVAPDDVDGGTQAVMGQYQSGGNVAWQVIFNSDGDIGFSSSNNGSTVVNSTSTVPVGFSDGVGFWGRVTWSPDTDVANYYTSADSYHTAYNKIIWEQLGDANVTHTDSALFNSGAVFEVGSVFAGAANVFAGKIGRAALMTSIGSGTPELDFDARTFTPGVTTATASTGEVWTQNGNCSIEQNIPSPWDASGPLGYLSEQAGTNILLQSNQFDTTWTNTNSIETANYAIAPDGTKTAWRLIDDSATGTGVVALVQSLTVASGSPSVNIVSVHAKQDQLTTLAIATTLYDTTEQSWFDLSAGTIGTTAHDNAWMEPLGDGWYRCSVEFQTTTDLAGTIQLRAAAADNNSTVDLDGTSSILVWGAQVEAGSFPTTYQPTAAASVARNVDKDAYDPTGNVSKDAGTFYAEFTLEPGWDVNASTNYHLWACFDTNIITDSLVIRLLGSTGKFQVFGYSGSVEQFAFNGTTTFIPRVTYSVALAWQENDVELYLNGVSIATDTSATMPTALSEMYLGSGGFAQAFDGNIRNVKIFNKRLNDSQVATL